MANSITLTLGTIALAGVAITVSGRPAANAGNNLTTSEVKVKKLSGDTFVDLTSSDYFLDAASSTGATIKAGTSASPTPFADSDLLLIQIVEGTEASDRVSVDFKQSYLTANAQNYSYQMPAETGKYEMQLLNVNDDTDVAAVKTADFPLRDAAKSTIATPLYKGYLTPLINQVATVDVTLQDVSQLGGDYQVSFSAKKQ